MVTHVHVSRIGLTPLKGARHVARQRLRLDLDGPVDDRVFALVDPVRGRVLRTVEHPCLVRTVVDWDGVELTVQLPDETVSGVPATTEDVREVDYWGRTVTVEVVAGPWAAAYARHLGLDVLLVRAVGLGRTVYGSSVSLVTTSSVDHLGERLGVPVDDARFRATFTVATPGEPPHVEDAWRGRRLRLGDAEVEVRDPLPRCAVIDFDPASGERRVDVLKCLGGYRHLSGEILFGVDAVVTRPGDVAVGVVLERS
jgi:uncharacterized protein YcbX